MDRLVATHLDGEAEELSTITRYSQRFIVRVTDSDGENAVEYPATVVFEEVVLTTDDPRDKATARLVDIDLDELPDTSMEPLVREKIERWAKAHSILVTQRV